MIEDAAFAELETDGELPADRIETVLSAIFFVVSLIASAHGVKPEYVEQYAGNVYATRPHKYAPLTQEEREKREDDEVRRAFAGTLTQIKAALRRGEHTIARI